MTLGAAAPFDGIGNFHRELLERLAAPLLDHDHSAETARWFQQTAADMARNAEHWRNLYERHHGEQLALWQRFVQSTHGERLSPPADGRFGAPEWREPYFAYLAHSYLLACKALTESVEQSDLDAGAKKRYAFLARQFADAMSPANFFWSNPAAVRQAMATGGDSLTRGLRNLATDAKKGIVSTTDESAFALGRDLATTPGAVIFENDYVQVIQYQSAHAKILERPLLIVPPCINKYYILDLQPANSFVQHAAANDLAVFMISWRNVPASMSHATWNDYLEHGVMEAIHVVREVTECKQINALGFCVGGTLLASALAVLAARGEQPVASLTLLTTLLDYSDTGDLAVYIDEPYVARRERELGDGGLLQGRELALAFASLRPNDLIWRYVVNNYLLGSTPEAFDLLHWNADSTNLPGPMYAYYLRNMYLENNLREPDRLTMCGMPVNLARVTMPTYVLATRGDHIVPWKTAYASTGLLGGKIDFVLASSGHIAGVINPPAPARRSYWAGGAPGPDPEDWLAGATSHPGSWWPHWVSWLRPHCGKSKPAATTLGSSRYPVIEPAPGRYVRERAEEQIHGM